MTAQCDKFKYGVDIKFEKTITDFVYTTEFISFINLLFFPIFCIMGLTTNGVSILTLIKNKKQNKLTKKSSVYLVKLMLINSSLNFVYCSIYMFHMANICIGFNGIFCSSVKKTKNRFDLLRGEQNHPKSIDRFKHFLLSVGIILVHSYHRDNYLKFILNDLLLFILIVIFDGLLLIKLKQAMSHKLKVSGCQKKKISEKENFENRITYSVLFNCLVLMILRSFELVVSFFVLFEIIQGSACSNAVKICSNISQLGNTFYLISCSLNLNRSSC
ncbi:hypothetical protein BpHYR1_046804 [Brachionus plicatilis]|uniref:Uncharacterized protein n=1 Tax=Brachionus plicatilis TaxID=10195 RepID=A0A3M7QCF9_BRAPC|nr:hypothetical protein BpHYR1_046804 [Brachionus plicatilis]